MLRHFQWYEVDLTGVLWHPVDDPPPAFARTAFEADAVFRPP